MNACRTKRAPVTVNPLFTHESELRLSLSGRWRFRLDPEDIGVRDAWFRLPFVFQEFVNVPGCWQGQGFGSDEPEMHKEFHTAVRPFRATYEGTGWYARSFVCPESYQGKRIWLYFGGSNPTTEVWLNGEHLGTHHLPLLSFGFDITDLVRIGQENFLTVRISEEDRLLGLTYYYCGKWSGLYRDVELVATGASYVDSLAVYTDPEAGSARVKASVGGEADGASLSVTVTAPNGVCFTGVAAVEDRTAELTLTVGDPALWSPDTPNLYRIEAVLTQNGTVSDARIDRFGFTRLTAEGKQFCINGKPYYMRGTGDFGENPETGSPNTNREHWRKCLRALRDMGYNYVRCQSFVPVPEYFDAADEVGLLVQSEMGILGPIAGKSMYYTYNMWPKPTPEYRDAYRDQWNGIVLRDVNHPAANLYCMSNELSDTYFPKTAWRCYRETKELKPTSLVIWTDGRYRPQFPTDYVNDQASTDAICDKPVIQHEFKWWSSFPDVRLAEKYDGCAMRHFSAELALEVAGRRGLTHILPDAAKNSQILQVLEAKGKMEALRRDFPTLAGVCHFNAMDTGMSSQGLLDMFYEQKHVTPEVWRQVNGDTVILTDLDFHTRILTPETERVIRFFVSDYAHPAYTSPVLSWSLEADGSVLLSGEFTYAHTPYTTVPAGEIRISLPKTESPRHVTLRASLTDGERCAENAWDLWLFPSAVSLDETVYRSLDGELSGTPRTVVTTRLTEELIGFAQSGGAVVLCGSEGLVRPFVPILGLNKGRYFFTRPASFPPYEELQCGTIVQTHPIFGSFPHGGYADLQFYNMIAESPALDLEGLGLADGDPIIRSIHSYQVGRPLGYLLERRLGRGGIVVTSMNLDPALPEAAYLLREITRYASNADFSDLPEVTDTALAALVSGTNIDP